MRKLFVALALALVLLVPGTPAPSRAGTFEFEITGPILVLFEANEALTQISAVACLGAGGSSVRWIGVTADSEGGVDEGYVGALAKLKDKPDKLKATFADKAKDAASEDIQFVDVDASTEPDTGTVEGVKATMKGAIKRYVVDPGSVAALAGTSGKLKVKDKTNKQKLTINATAVFKDSDLSCTVDFDDTGKPVSLRVGGTKPGALNLHLGR